MDKGKNHTKIYDKNRQNTQKYSTKYIKNGIIYILLKNIWGDVDG